MSFGSAFQSVGALLEREHWPYGLELTDGTHTAMTLAVLATLTKKKKKRKKKRGGGTFKKKPPFNVPLRDEQGDVKR